MANVLPIVLGIACLMLVGIGLRVLFAPEARKESYIPVKATVTKRLTNGNGDLMPSVEFNADGKRITSRFRTAIPSGTPCREGTEMDILYCHSPVLFMDSYTIVLDDQGKSMKRNILFYRAMGIGMIIIGLLLLIPLVLILRK